MPVRDDAGHFAKAPPPPFIPVDIEAQRATLKPYERSTEDARALVAQTEREVERLVESAVSAPTPAAREAAGSSAARASERLGAAKAELSFHEAVLRRKQAEIAPYFTSERQAAAEAQKAMLQATAVAAETQMRKAAAALTAALAEIKAYENLRNQMAALTKGPGYRWSAIDQQWQGRFHWYIARCFREVSDRNAANGVTPTYDDDWCNTEVRLMRAHTDDALARLG